MKDLFEKAKKIMTKKKYNKAFKLFMKCAEQDDKEAMWYVGNCYYNGIGARQDYEKAVKWYKPAAELGNSAAMSSLGKCYYDGNGIEQNYEKALEWYTKAIEKGNITALYDIAMLYDTLGDFENAKKYFNKVLEFEEFEDMIDEVKEKLASY